MTPLDMALAVSGRLATGVERRAGSHRATWLVVIALITLSAVPTFLIGISQRPTDLTFDDVRFGHIPAMTSWVRLEGDLRPFASDGVYLYELYDLQDDRLYVVVTAMAPLEVGHTVVTGRLALGATTGNIGSVDADVPAVPKQNEPFGLILLPAAIGIVIVVGMRLGYPVIRRDRPSREPSRRLGPGESLAARWSGWIGSETVDRSEPTPCTIRVTFRPEVSEMTLTAAAGVRTVRVRHGAPIRLVRLCRVGGSGPGPGDPCPGRRSRPGVR